MNKITSSATKITLLVLTLALIYMSVMGVEINETFKTSYLMVLSFYFGQKTNQLNNQV